MPDAITDILFRGRFDGTPALDLRADPGEADDAADGTTLVGHFSKYDSWYEINSWIEGHFLERLVAGSHRKTIKENRSSIVVAFDHGYDPTIADKPLGPIEELRDEDEGPYYEVPLLDTDYNRDFILPALQGRTMDGRKLGSVLGASFKFRVVKDEWNMAPKKSDYNPDGIPERTIREVRLFEFGPVVYPANPEATAGVRCLTDHFHDRHRERAIRSGRILQPSAAAGTDASNTTEPLEHSEASPTRSAAHIAAITARLRAA